MVAELDYEPLIRKLLDKTKKGRIPWGESLSSRGDFVTSLDEGYTFAVRSTGDGFQLFMKDSQGKLIFSVSAVEDVVFGDSRQKELFEMLSEIYELARRKALDVDKKLETASALLDKI